MGYDWISIKKMAIKKVIAALESELETAQKSSQQARAGSTHSDAVAKSKYETQSTELSYLANGQAQRAKTLLNQIKLLESLNLNKITPKDQIQLYSVVELQTMDTKKYIFISPIGGAQTFSIADIKLQVISDRSPIGKKLIGLEVGDEVDEQEVLAII